MNQSNKERFMYALAAFVIGLLFASFGLLVFYQTPAENHDAIMLGLGTLLGFGSSVIGYFFGSSKSSADKTQLLADKTTADPANQG